MTAFFIFDGRNTNKTNWMSKERFKASSYTDLTNSSVGSLEYLQTRYNIIDKYEGCFSIHVDIEFKYFTYFKTVIRCLILSNLNTVAADEWVHVREMQ